MWWLMEKLTGQVAVYVCGALLGLAAVAGVAAWWAHSSYVDEVAAHAATKETLTRAVSANTAWAGQAKKLEDALVKANRENLRVRQEGDAAVAAANRRAQQSRNELAAFRELFDGKTQTCAEALVKMEESCAELSDY